MTNVGNLAETFLKRFCRRPDEAMQDLTIHFENDAKELLAAAKEIAPKTERLMCEELETLWLLRRAGLPATGRGNVLRHARNRYG